MNQSEIMQVGIMQGRLSAPDDGKIQSFPVKTWADEFPLAKKAGLASIEWIYEANTDVHNPFKDEAGIAQVLKLSNETGVKVNSICADYYMVHLLLDDKGMPVKQHIDHLLWLIGQGKKAGVKYIVLPFVDASSLKSSAHLQGLKDLLDEVLPKAQEANIELHLETDLNPLKLQEVYTANTHPNLRANYDIGNSAALGYSHAEELTVVKDCLGSVHIKDRVLNGGTVALGTGAADFSICFRHFLKAGYTNPYILQVARSTEMSELELAKKNRNFVESQLKKAMDNI